VAGRPGGLHVQARVVFQIWISRFQQAIRIRSCAPQKFHPRALDVASSSGDNKQEQRVASQRDALARGGRIRLWALAFRRRLHPYRHWLPAPLRVAAHPILGETSPETSIAVEPMAPCRAAFLQYVLGKGKACFPCPSALSQGPTIGV
jgi:hypothetical protein